MAGSFSMLYEAEVKIKLPKLNVMAHIFVPFHVTSPKNNYDVIFGRDLRQMLGINIDFQINFVGWKETNVPMKLNKCKIRIHFAIQEGKNIRSATNRIKKS